MPLKKTFDYNIQLTTNGCMNISGGAWQTLGNIFITNGNVGINNTAPNFTLDVAGSLHSNSTLTDNNVSTNNTVTNFVTTFATVGNLSVNNLTALNTIYGGITTGSLYINSTSSSALTISGGMSVNKDTYLGGNVFLSSGNINLINTNGAAQILLTNSLPTKLNITNSCANGLINFNSNNGPIMFNTGLNGNTFAGGFDGSANFFVTNNLNVSGGMSVSNTISGELFQSSSGSMPISNTGNYQVHVGNGYIGKITLYITGLWGCSADYISPPGGLAVLASFASSGNQATISSASSGYITVSISELTAPSTLNWKILNYSEFV